MLMSDQDDRTTDQNLDMRGAFDAAVNMTNETLSRGGMLYVRGMTRNPTNPLMGIMQGDGGVKAGLDLVRDIPTMATLAFDTARGVLRGHAVPRDQGASAGVDRRI